MGNSRVKKWKTASEKQDRLRSAPLWRPYSGGMMTVVLVVLALVLGQPSVAQEAEEPPSLRSVVASATENLLADNDDATVGRVIIRRNASELERYAALLAQSQLSRARGCDAPPAPLTTSVPDTGLPETLDARNSWLLQQHQPTAATGFLLRIETTQKKKTLSAGTYSPGSGQRENTFQGSFSVPDTLAFLLKAREQKLKQSSRRWLDLLSRLFPPCTAKRGSANARSLTEACHFFRRGFWKKAAHKLGKLTDTEPTECILYYVFALHMAGEDEKAMKQVEAGIKRQPDNGPLYALKTWLLHTSDKTSDALMTLQQARLSDVQREGMYHLARHFAARDEGKKDLAKQAMKKATQTAPTNSYVQLKAAEYYWNSADLKSSVKHYLAAIESGANRPEIWAEYGIALDALGKTEDAREAFLKAFSLNPADNSVARQLSAMYRNDGQYEKALQVLSSSARQGPDVPAMYMAWGNAAATMWQTDEAVRAYRQAVEKDGAAASTGLASMYARKRQFSKAGNLLDRVIKSNPKYLEARILKGRIFVEQKKYKKALEVLSEALEEANEEVPARLARARVYSMMGQHDKAINEAQIAVAASPSGKTYSTLANMFTAKEKYDRARSALKLGKKKDSESAHLLHAFGQLYAAEKKLGKALTALRKSLEIDPHQPEVLILTGKLHRKQGKIDQSARDWKRAADMDPWNADLQWRLAELLRKNLHSPQQSLPYYERHAELDGQHAARAQELANQIKSNHPGEN